MTHDTPELEDDNGSRSAARAHSATKPSDTPELEDDNGSRSQGQRRAAPSSERIADAMPSIIDAAYRLWLALDRAVPLEDVLALGVRLYRAESADATRHKLAALACPRDSSRAGARSRQRRHAARTLPGASAA